jgi:hypothetical protein
VVRFLIEASEYFSSQATRTVWEFKNIFIRLAKGTIFREEKRPDSEADSSLALSDGAK